MNCPAEKENGPLLGRLLTLRTSTQLEKLSYCYYISSVASCASPGVGEAHWFKSVRPSDQLVSRGMDDGLLFLSPLHGQLLKVFFEA